MKHTLRTLSIGLCLMTPMGADFAKAEQMTKEQILTEAENMAIEKFDHLRWNFTNRKWIDGVSWAGVSDLAAVSTNPKLMEALTKMGERELRIGKDKAVYGKWTLIHHALDKEPHHADDMIVGEAFLYVYEQTHEPLILEDVKRRVDEASASILSPERAEKAAKADELDWQEGLTWYWCDALFMAAPLHARLSAVTGDPKYREAMHVEWKRASDLLYDPEEHLYFRDKNFLTKPTKNQQKTFWSRGNGWVVGALARMLPYIPKDDPKREWYVNQFKEMSAKLASLQQPDGTWSPSLLDYKQFPFSEMSGTALNCFALAWGINNGILDEKTYRPVVEKAWAAMLNSRKDNEKGFLGYVQAVGAEPARVFAHQYTWYGNGAFLMAAVQVAQMAPINIPDLPPLSAAPRPEPKT